MNFSRRVRRSAGIVAVASWFLVLGACDNGSGAAQYSIGGTVSGLSAGESVTLANNGGHALSVSGNGDFTFPTLVPQNGSYDVTVADQPKGQVCSVSYGSGANLSSTMVDVRVSCATATYTISGSLAGLPSDGKLTLEDNGTDPLILSANGPFSFAAPVNYDGSYVVTVASQPTGATCTVSKGSGAGVTAAIRDVMVTCSTDTYPVSGTLSGLPSGQQLVLQNNSADALRLSANGPFTFATRVAYDGSYAVTVTTQPVEAICSVTHGTGAGVTTAIAGISVLCSLDTYTVSGTVSGLATGAQVTLDDNGGDAVTVAANGVFTFATPVAAGGSYTVTVGTQPTGETCTVVSGQGSQVSGNVSSVIVTCSTNSYTIGGTLSGLASGAQISLDNNGGDPLTLNANGTFTFGTSVAYGGVYDVTVATAPSGQVCGVSNASGTNVFSNITNVSVACSASVLSYPTPGSYTWAVPNGVTSIQIVATGGGGGGGGAGGGFIGGLGGNAGIVTTTISVNPGDTLNLFVGGGGGAGGNGGSAYGGGAGGGGSTNVNVNAATSSQVIAGGGGGGAGANNVSCNGGNGNGGNANCSRGAGWGGSGGANGIGGIGGSDGMQSAPAGGNGNGGAGGLGGANGGSISGGSAGNGSGGGSGGNGALNCAAGGGGGFGGGGAGAELAGGGGGGSTGPAGSTFSVGTNGGVGAANGGDGSIVITLNPTP